MQEKTNSDLSKKPSFMSDQSYSAALRFLERLQKIDRELACYESGEKTFTLPVFFDEEIGKWTITTEFCTIGGCDMGILEFENETAAKLEAMYLSEKNVHPKSERACYPCYQEYMRDAY
ncbi:hypothetical protein [Cohnella soli]|uniref:Uncharacterized protein n=1 Tax=Cohnella soli TaxID=425005 RepID=A0ABW0HMF5_9BACL